MAIAKKKKRFFEVDIPIIGRETQLRALELSELDGRFINYDLTRVLRGKNLVLQLQVKVDTAKERAKAIPNGLKLMPSYLRRMVRKGTNYVEDSFSTNTKDAQIKIKPFLITRRKVSRAVRKALREKAREDLIEYTKTKTSEEIFDDIMKNTLQKTLSLRLKKIYPLSLCEIRMLKVEKTLEKSPVKTNDKKE